MRSTPRRLLVVSAIGAALVASAVPAQAQVATASRLVLAAGHVDVVDVEYEDGVLEIGVHDETVDPGVEREPDDVLFKVKREARTTVPTDPAFGFLGAPGAPVWILPEAQDESLLWPGLSSEELEAGVFSGDAVTLSVVRVVGPGQLAVYTENAVGQPNLLIDSGDGTPDTIGLNVGGHLHANWAFDQAGTYTVKVKAIATLAASGQRVSSETVNLRFVVKS
ncbi:choice-of-anchor M domain-containing protein [Plantactinospora solaniradicis]|uniref:Choice-of-anchor M domain-containing protein n=1 Tax=Plantactinospora solaniradicis TaxID=1723736 RepID=A0ABW1KAB1_9ACTN